MRQQKTQSPKGLGHNLKVANTAGNIISFRRGKLGVPKEYPQTNWHHLHFCNTSSALAKALAHTKTGVVGGNDSILVFLARAKRSLSFSEFQRAVHRQLLFYCFGTWREIEEGWQTALALERLISTIEEIEILGHSPKRVNISVEEISFYILNPSWMSLF